jgi:zinc protease
MRLLQIGGLSAAFLLAAVRVHADVPGSNASKSVFPYAVNKSVLDNGLTVVSVPYDSPGIVAYFTIVRAGSRNEVEKGLSGFAHFFEHMMFRGTEAYSEEKYNSLLRSLGSDFNAYTNNDWTCYHLTIPATALETVVEVEADRFQHLKYGEAAFQKESRAVLGEYNKGASSPLQRLNETLQTTAYTTHTYKHTTIGFLADIKDMPNQYAYSKAFFDRWYRPENCTIIAAGDVKHEALISLCTKYYGGWKRGSSRIEIPVEPPQTGPRTAHVTWPVPTLPIVVVAYHIPSADPANPDTAALGALAEEVFGETSPIYDQLVLKEHKVESLDAEAESKRDPGLFAIMARVRNADDVALVRARIKSALDDAARKPVAAARLSGIKSHLRHQFAVSLQNASDVAEAVGTAVAITGRPDSINELYDAYDRLTPADLQRVARNYLQPGKETVVTLETELKK